MKVAPVVCFAPHGALEGYVNFANAACVVGWAWDRSRPQACLAVEIWDGAVLLATIPAETFRKDVREGGIGDGRHAFAYALDGHIRDRRAHQITVRIAGSDVTLRDATTNGLSPPLTRRDRPTPAPIPHFSMPPVRRWFSYMLLPLLLRPFPRPIWRPPAVALGVVQMLLDRPGRALNVALLRALGISPSPVARWRLHWRRAYARQAELLMLAQVERLTPQWAVRQVRVCGTLPPDGAILLSVHHSVRRLAPLVLDAPGRRFGVITTRMDDPVTLANADATLRAHWRLADRGDTSVYGDRQFSRRGAGRGGLRLLGEGGYLIMYADDYAREGPLSPLLGRAMLVPRGAVWLATHSGKPIVPFMIVPDGPRWRLWLGAAVTPTQDGLCRALEECIRHAPGSWQRAVAMAWMEAPPWGAQPEPASQAVAGDLAERRAR